MTIQGKSSIYDTLNNTLREAMLSKNRVKADMIRAIKARLEEYEVSHGLDRSKTPNDEHMVKVLQAHRKSLEKGIAQLEKGGQKAFALIDSYKEEIKLCELYLPNTTEQREEVTKAVSEALGVLNVDHQKKSIGLVIKHVMANNPHLDGRLVKEVVLEKLKG
jgi:uncharacterized protein YqeY